MTTKAEATAPIVQRKFLGGIMDGKQRPLASDCRVIAVIEVHMGLMSGSPWENQSTYRLGDVNGEEVFVCQYDTARLHKEGITRPSGALL